MIYVIAEDMATVLENLFLFLFLIGTLSYKEKPMWQKRIGTVLFFALQCAAVFWLNSFISYEGLLAILYMLICLLFCRCMLKNKFLFQLILILFAFSAISIINISVSSIAGKLLQYSLEEVIAMRNPLRIFLLFITKALLFFILLLISAFFRKKQSAFGVSQCVYILGVLGFTLLIGLKVENMETKYQILYEDGVMVMAGLIGIDILLFVAFYHFSVQNKSLLKESVLRLQLENEQNKIEESLRWSAEVETLRHDLNAHMLYISDLVQRGEIDKALDYMEKISKKVKRDIPQHTHTQSTVLNAIADAKRMECKEHGIELKYSLPKDLPGIEETDLCALLSNLFDNAIEAEQREEQREIRLQIAPMERFWHITMQNRVSLSVLQKNKELKTSKKDKKAHGFGTKSITDIVKRNNGTVKYYEEDGWFIADVMIMKME